ncbi:bifunctional diguanylate cyclase/phosphodiesterase [Aestuariibacter sp. A3R04]|uniref:putative bifunctional diguanylate cyclase/phosphodiesterase n=1 Tax=Aestuariibacter sp. A3R04 TaxID=2841571 RepID=UPI001C089031|nr:EAL domain-containing protein [Aestuariibacter sp. A3R04]MBU3021966.1 EAL domain-containing protein [Aestuariibacter sp. A3R04]
MPREKKNRIYLLPFVLFTMLSGVFVVAGAFLIQDDLDSRVSKAASLARQVENSMSLFASERRQAMINLMQSWPAFSANDIDWFNAQAVSLMNMQYGYTSLAVTDEQGSIRWITLPNSQGISSTGFSMMSTPLQDLGITSFSVSDDFHSTLIQSGEGGHYYLVYSRAISPQEPHFGFLIASFDVSEILDMIIGDLVGPQFNFMILDGQAHLLEEGEFENDGSTVTTEGIDFLGRQWTLHIQSQPGRFNAGWLIAIVGIAMSLLVSWVLHKQLKSALNLVLSQRRYQTASDAALDGLMIYKSAGDDFLLLEANKVSYQLFPRLGNQQSEKSLKVHLDYLGHSALLEKAFEVAKTGEHHETYLHTESDATEAEWLKIQMVKAEETLAMTVRDVSERFRARMALQRSEERYRRLVDNMHRHFVYTKTPDHQFVYVSAGLQTILGISEAEFCRRSSQMVCQVPDNYGEITERIQRGEKPEPYFVHFKGADGKVFIIEFTDTPICSQTGELEAVEGIARDVTKEQVLQDEVAYQASHDQLTGLMNRYAFDNELHLLLESVERDEQFGVMCFIDMDRFKLVNDSCGHPAGDKLLKEVADLFRQQVTDQELLARIGGDEFCIIFRNQKLTTVTAKLDNMLQAISNYRFIHEDRLFYVGASIGVIPVEKGSGTAAELIKAADNACYQAKYEGRNRYYVHRGNGDTEGLSSESNVLNVLNTAVQNGKFELFSQSIMPMKAGKNDLLHYEILLRLPDGNGGLISPALFIPLAERHGLMNKIDWWVVDKTLTILEAHPAHINRLGKVAINLSGLTLGDNSQLQKIVDRVVRSTVPPEKICFEITETTAVTNIGAAKHFMETLKDKGCRFALDDFGAGMSSFTYLKNLDVDYVKIDGSFVRNMARDSIDHETVKAISAIAHSMGKQTIAEFVADQETCDALRELRVDYGQGYALGKPIPLMNRLAPVNNVTLLRA